MKLTRCLSLLCLLLAACDLADFSASLAQPGQVLLQEDFSSTSSGWPSRTSEAGTMDYFAGAYRIQVNVPNYNLWAVAGHEYTDVRLEVDAGPLSGVLENRFGLICRHQDNQNFYFFVISADGYYGLGKVSAGQLTLFNREMMNLHPAIQRGFASNHLRLDCVGDTLTAYVNGQPIDQARDSQLARGRVGLLAGTFESVSADVVFDNFQVVKP